MTDSLLDVCERIFMNIRDHETTQHRYAPLWEHPLILEALISVLKFKDHEHRHSFRNVCCLLCPTFIAILDEIPVESFYR